MSLITDSYFINDINLPVQGSGVCVPQAFIDKFEKEFLIKCFGYGLYKLIAEYNSETSPQRIKDIVEGKEFEDDPYTYKWNGLVNDELVSPVAYYIYYHFSKDNLSHTTTIGEVKSTSENSNVITENAKLLKAWQSMFKLVGHPNDYSLDSLYYFMRTNYEDYPEWLFEGFENINSFDL